MREERYTAGKNIVKYLTDDEGRTTFVVVPESCEDKIQEQWNIESGPFDPRARYMHNFYMGCLAYVHICGKNPGRLGRSLKICDFVMVSREHINIAGKEAIVTYLKNDDNVLIKHTLTFESANGGFKIETELINKSGKAVKIDMISSFTLDNLSPMQKDDAPNKYRFHRFLSGWSMEGRHKVETIEDMNLEKTWAGFNCGSERFGSLGGYPTGRYFPMAVFEDTEAGICWAAAIEHNCTWQMELTRGGNTFSFSGGLGDGEFCGWNKVINDGGSFKAPTAYVSCVKGEAKDACEAILDIQDKPKSLDVVFNEYCTTWGKPTQEKMLSYCKTLKELGVKYAVIDAGWSKAGCEQDSNGEWNVDTSIFPDIKEMTRQMREMGIIPGIWFEFEVTTKGSKLYEPEYDFMKLKDDGKVIDTGDFRSYWDFRRSDVREYLSEKVIKFLKENGFGYIKVDYNGNPGIRVDGEESGAEELRKHYAEVRDFFIQMKKEIPDLVIENCASGGNRLEPSMMNVSDLASFSDAHEAVEIPYIAANLHNLIVPSKELIWAVVHSDDDKDRLVYSLAATFLGRMCLSGEIDNMQDWQKDIIKQSIDFYNKLSNIILNGKTDVLGSRGKSMRYPEGVQIVKRYTGNEMLVVYHGFENAVGEFEVEIPDGFKRKDGFYDEAAEVLSNKIVIKAVKDFSAGAILLERA